MTSSLTQDTNELRKISDLPTELALRQAASFLAHLVKEPDFLESRILSLLEGARDREDWYVAYGHDAEDGSFSLQVFVWPPGTGTVSTTTPPGGRTAAPSGPCSKSATSAWTTAPGPSTPA